MLLEWKERKDFDGNMNTSYRGSSDWTNSKHYFVKPRLYGNRLVFQATYLANDQSMTIANPQQKESLIPYFTSLIAAQESCEKHAAKLAGKTITAADVILDWVAKSGKNLTFIDAFMLARITGSTCPEVSSAAIQNQLQEWCEKGVLTLAYACKGPEGSLGRGPKSDKEFWSEPGKIPAILYDTSDERFRRDNGEILIVYRLPSKGPISGLVEAVKALTTDVGEKAQTPLEGE